MGVYTYAILFARAARIYLPTSMCMACTHGGDARGEPDTQTYGAAADSTLYSAPGRARGRAPWCLYNQPHRCRPRARPLFVVQRARETFTQHYSTVTQHYSTITQHYSTFYHSQSLTLLGVHVPVWHTYNLVAQIIHLYVRCESIKDKVLNMQQPRALVHALPLAPIETDCFTLRVPLQSHLRSIGKPGCDDCSEAAVLAQPVGKRVKWRTPVESGGASKGAPRTSAWQIRMHSQVLAALEVDEQAGRKRIGGSEDRMKVTILVRPVGEVKLFAQRVQVAHVPRPQLVQLVLGHSMQEGLVRARIHLISIRGRLRRHTRATHEGL